MEHLELEKSLSLLEFQLAMFDDTGRSLGCAFGYCRYEYLIQAAAVLLCSWSDKRL